jgi:hypothetical protein
MSQAAKIESGPSMLKPTIHHQNQKQRKTARKRWRIGGHGGVCIGIARLGGRS